MEWWHINKSILFNLFSLSVFKLTSARIQDQYSPPGFGILKGIKQSTPLLWIFCRDTNKQATAISTNGARGNRTPCLCGQSFPSPEGSLPVLQGAWAESSSSLLAAPPRELREEQASSSAPLGSELCAQPDVLTGGWGPQRTAPNSTIWKDWKNHRREKKGGS